MTAKEWLKAYATRNGTIPLDTMLKEAAKLIEGIDKMQNQIEVFQADISRLDSILAKTEDEKNKINNEVLKLANDVKFLQGQVEAYQHCINCISCIRT